MSEPGRQDDRAAEARPESHPDPEPERFEQLALGPTITGPGRRTEDLYEPGTLLTIRGERGTFRYRHASLSRDGRISLHLVGNEGYRAVRPDEVIPVRQKRHRR